MLKLKLDKLGYNHPELDSRLREQLSLGGQPFSAYFEKTFPNVTFWTMLEFDLSRAKQAIELQYYQAGLKPLNRTYSEIYTTFSPDITRDEACQVLAKMYFTPVIVDDFDLVGFEKDNILPFLSEDNPKQINFFNQINQSNMNTQNLEFLKKSLLNLGFGEQVNAELEKNINNKVPEFRLPAQHEFNQQKVDYTLHFKAGENQEMYFFNKFDATLNKGKAKELNQTFYINKGNGITAKEAFNLMEGRAVHKQLFNKDGEKYQAWLQLDDEKLTQNGSKEIKRFNENYGFDVEQVIAGKDIKEMKTAEGQDSLLRSLKKGNAQQITVERDGGEKKYFIAASPQFKTVDLYDHQMKKIKREELLQPKQNQGNNQKQNAQQKEELPGKKQSRKSKLAV